MVLTLPTQPLYPFLQEQLPVPLIGTNPVGTSQPRSSWSYNYNNVIAHDFNGFTIDCFQGCWEIMWAWNFGSFNNIGDARWFPAVPPPGEGILHCGGSPKGPIGTITSFVTFGTYFDPTTFVATFTISCAEGG